MRNKVVDTEPFKLTYRPYNKTTGEYHGEFACLLEAAAYCNANFTKSHWDHKAISHTLKYEGEVKYISRTDWTWDEPRKRFRTGHVYAYAPATPWVIVSERGVVTADELKVARAANREPYRNRGWEARESFYRQLGERLTRKKGSGDKVKLSCGMVPSRYYGDYSNDVRGYFRGVRTTPERRWNEAHENEYGPGIVRSARNRRNLPNSWDDIGCSIARSERSWKHHSKRRKQWKPK